MKLAHVVMRVVLLGLALVLTLYGCDGDDDGDDEPLPANAAFNGTFSGNLVTTQGEQDLTETFTASLTVGSPLSGTFDIDDGMTSGTIAGEAEGDTATFTGTLDGACPRIITDGSATLLDDNTLSVDVSGSDCDGLFTSTGTATRVLNALPGADAGSDQNTTTGSLVTLDGSGSSDGDLLTFAWSFVSVPAGSTAVLSDSTVVNPSFVADQPGTYIVQLIVNDGLVDSAPDTVTITASTPSNACGGPEQVMCMSNSFCDFPLGSCGEGEIFGTCQLLPEVCLAVFDPVCGCDGVTYGNGCEAARAGVSIASEGEC